MKTKQLIPAALSFLFIMLFAVADAQPIPGKTFNQRHRIHQGVKDGALTKGESARLHHQQHYIRREKIAAKKNDGRIDRFERSHIRRDQRKASRNIYRAKHNKYHRH